MFLRQNIFFMTFVTFFKGFCNLKSKERRYAKYFDVQNATPVTVILCTPKKRLPIDQNHVYKNKNQFSVEAKNVKM